MNARAAFGVAIEPFNWLSSLATTLLRFWAGWRDAPAPIRPAAPIVLYEFEGCPYCRITRETVSALRIPAEIRPCPKAGARFRPEVVARGGKAQFPYLIDPNAGVEMYESAAISRYLYMTYGARSAPWTLSPLLHALDALHSSLSLIPRLGAGQVCYRRNQEIAEPLRLAAAEADPRARLVREILCALELPYLLDHDASSAPLLSDPNTGDRFAASFAARRHLLRTYAEPIPPVRTRSADCGRR